MISKKNVAFVDRFDFKRLPTGLSQTEISRSMNEIAFSASFFRRYWLILDSEIEDAERFSKSVDELTLDNVSITLLAPEQQDERKLAVSTGE